MIRTALLLSVLCTACTPTGHGIALDQPDPTIRCKRTDATDTLVVGQTPLIDFTQYDHDDRWNETLAEINLNDAGIASDTILQTFDADDNLLTRSEDNGNDGTIEREQVYTYDAEGHQLTHTIDENGDGVPNQRTSQTWIGDNLATKRVDRNGDGTIEEASVFTYDGDLLVRVEVDITGDEVPDGIAVYSYTDDLLQRIEWDDDADGAVDEIQTFQHDEDGNISQRDIDAPADGSIDKRDTWSWEGGFVVREESDYDADGATDFVVLYTRDAHGNPTQTQLDLDADGTADVTTDETWVCEDE